MAPSAIQGVDVETTDFPDRGAKVVKKSVTANLEPSFFDRALKKQRKELSVAAYCSDGMEFIAFVLFLV